MEQQTDRRVRKTRAALRAGLEQMMREKSVQDITVKELCAVCDINRGTFYAHYSDVNDLLAAVERELWEGFAASLGEAAPSVRADGMPAQPDLTAMLCFFKENAAMCRVLLCDNGDMNFVEQVKCLVRERLLPQWDKAFAGRQHAVSDYTYAFMVSGCIGILQQWLTDAAAVEPQRMAVLMEDLLLRGLGALR